MRNKEIEQESLHKAIAGQSFANYVPIISGFMARGIPESEIVPRENVFTYNAWRALGRQVRKGEHGVRCLTFITTKDKKTGEESRRPWSTTVFHVSQTEPITVQFDNASRDAMSIYHATLDATAENVPYAGESEAVQS